MIFSKGAKQGTACCGSIRMYTFALLGIAVQYALVDGLTAMMPPAGQKKS